jgi:hypothetical protein
MILHVCVDLDVIYFVYNIGICLFIMCIADDIDILARRPDLSCFSQVVLPQYLQDYF